jgi:cytochrome c oxidase subunit 1
VIGHFHYVVAPGTIFAFFAGLYYWYPKATGRKMNETLGKVHFWSSMVFMNGVFMPMFWIGLAGVSRRLYDAGMTYGFEPEIFRLTAFSSWCAWLLALSQVPFFINFFWSLRHGEVRRSQPVAVDDRRVAGAVAAAARQLRPRADHLPRPV